MAYGGGTGTTLAFVGLMEFDKLVADHVGDAWRDMRKRSSERATVAVAKQVLRTSSDGELRGDVIARAEEQLPGRPLLAPFCVAVRWCARRRSSR